MSLLSLILLREVLSMSEKIVRQRSAAKTVAIDNRREIAKTRLLLLLSLLFSAALAVLLVLLFAH